MSQKLSSKYCGRKRGLSSILLKIHSPNICWQKCATPTLENIQIQPSPRILVNKIKVKNIRGQISSKCSVQLVRKSVLHLLHPASIGLRPLRSTLLLKIHPEYHSGKQNSLQQSPYHDIFSSGSSYRLYPVLHLKIGLKVHSCLPERPAQIVQKLVQSGVALTCSSEIHQHAKI